MKKKIIGILVCTLLIATIIPISTANEQPISQSLDDVEITIYAGHFGKDIGFGISIDILNHKNEDVICYFNTTFDFIFRDHWDFTHEWNITVPPERPWQVRHSTGMKGIKHISITTEAEGTIASRSGISIGKIMIFNE
jgi:hypothetical protein